MHCDVLGQLRGQVQPVRALAQHMDVEHLGHLCVDKDKPSRGERDCADGLCVLLCDDKASGLCCAGRGSASDQNYWSLPFMPVATADLHQSQQKHCVQ